MRYCDSKDAKRRSGLVTFIVIDYICDGPLDIKFVIQCYNPPNRILAISNIYSFDVRCSYPIKKYHIFHALERYNYEIVDKNSIDYNPIEDVRKIIFNIFSPLEVFTVKKSLCVDEDLDSFIYENKSGEYKIISENDKVPIGYKYTGICMGKYIKGLAYPEGKRPTEHDSYIFFHSRDYYEIIFDKNSNDFFTFCQTNHTHSKYREPKTKDSILAIPFQCGRDNYKGKTNLRWFYPTNELRILHLYITTNVEHSYFKDLEYDDIVNKIKSNPILEELLNLYIFGMTQKNPTLDCEFTKHFLYKFFWWNKK